MKVDPKVLKIDTYQRPKKEQWVAKMARTVGFSPSDAGVLDVSLYDDQLWLVDGQQRRHLAVACDVEQVMVLVVEENRESAALRCARLNKEKSKFTALDEHRARSVAGEPLAVMINDVLAHHGRAIVSGGNSPTRITCIKAVNDVAQLGRDVLEATCVVLFEAWPNATIPSAVWRGVARVAILPNCDLKRLSRVLAKHRPEDIIIAAHNPLRVNGEPSSKSLSDIIVAIYNRGLRNETNKLRGA
jgi:hypothetical protein